MPDVRQFPMVPLLGQPAEVLGWTLLVYVSCKACSPPSFVPLVITQTPLGRSTNMGICPTCARTMHVTQLSMNAQNQLEFGLEIGAAPPKLGARPD